MAATFPTSLKTFTDLSSTTEMDDSGLEGDTVINEIHDEVEALQTKVGVDSSAVATSLDYKLTNASSSNPGHKHTLAQGATDVTASVAEINYVDGVTSAIQTQIDAKAPSASPTFTGTATFGDGVLAATSPKITTGINDANGNEVIKTPATASAVNEITVTNAATTGSPTISATGGDDNISLAIKAKGTGNIQIQGNYTGWTYATDTWTYASASTFTISGVDRTSYYTKGTRLTWAEGATRKFGVVVSSAFSTNTTVTIAVNTDYVITNTTLSDCRYSYQANPTGYPTWFSFTTSYTGFSSDPTNNAQRYMITGNTCTVVIRNGTNGTSNATSFTVGAPVTAATVSNASWVGNGWFIDNNAVTTTNDFAAINSAGTSFELYHNGSATGWTNSQGKRANFSITYEI